MERQTTLNRFKGAKHMKKLIKLLFVFTLCISTLITPDCECGDENCPICGDLGNEQYPEKPIH